MLVARESVIPPTPPELSAQGVSGWHYVQDGTPVMGDSKQDLIFKVTQYRIANELDIGDPEKDIDEYICKNWPHYCNTVGEETTEEVGEPKGRTLFDRVSTQAKLWAKRAGTTRLVETDEANARAQICSTCPENVDRTNSCAPCIQYVDRSLIISSRNRKVTPKVRSCNVFGWDNSTACLMPADALNRRLEHLDAAPDFCWAKGL